MLLGPDVTVAEAASPSAAHRQPPAPPTTGVLACATTVAGTGRHVPPARWASAPATSVSSSRCGSYGRSRPPTRASSSKGSGIRGCGAQDREQPAARAGVQLGGQEALGADHAVDGEGAAEADPRPQVVTDAARHGTHRVGNLCGRVVERGAAGIEERRCRGAAQRDLLDGAHGDHVVREDDAVDAARHAFEERHDPHVAGAAGEGAHGVVDLVGVPHPAEPLGAAVPALRRVGRPHRAGAGVERGAGTPGGARLDRHDGRRRPRHPGLVPHARRRPSCRRGRATRGAGGPGTGGRAARPSRSGTSR